MDQQTIAIDYLSDIEDTLESWYTQLESKQNSSLSVIDNLEEDDQASELQDLIQIDRSIGKLVLMTEKLDLLVKKNDRIVLKMTIQIKSEFLSKIFEDLEINVNDQKKQAHKLRRRLRNVVNNLKKRIALLQSNPANDDEVGVSQMLVGSSQNTATELEDAQLTLHQALVQRNNLDS